MEKQTILITDVNGEKKEAEILAVFNSEEFDKDYVIYTFNETQDELVKILASTLVENGDSVSFEDIETDEEWSMVKKTMKDLAKEEE